MSINTNIPAGTNISIASANPATSAKEQRIDYTNPVVEKITAGNFVEDGSGGFKEITSISEVSVSLKKVTLSNMASVMVDGASSINVGDTITLNGGHTETILSISDAGTGTAYSISVDGGGSFVGDTVMVG
tara:strand:+ start:1961 stop:2353 length:393 start_codon:yes stop_codon:yes gene_type:complete